MSDILPRMNSARDRIVGLSEPVASFSPLSTTTPPDSSSTNPRSRIVCDDPTTPLISLFHWFYFDSLERLRTPVRRPDVHLQRPPLIFHQSPTTSFAWMRVVSSSEGFEFHTIDQAIEESDDLRRT